MFGLRCRKLQTQGKFVIGEGKSARGRQRLGSVGVGRDRDAENGCSAGKLGAGCCRCRDTR